MTEFIKKLGRKFIDEKEEVEENEEKISVEINEEANEEAEKKYNKKQDQEQALRKCPKCKEDLITDYKRGEIYCKKCGDIIEDSMVDRGPEWRAFDDDQVAKKVRTGSAIRFTKQDKGLVTEIDKHDRDIKGGAVLPQKKAQLYRLRKWQRRSRVAESTDRNLSLALPELDRICTQLHIPRSIQEDCAYFYRKAVSMGLTKGKNVESMVAATVFLVCKKHKNPQSLNTLRKLVGVKRRDIGRCITILKNMEKSDNGFLFSWEDVPGKDSKRVLNFLRNELNLPIGKKAKIEKKDNDHIILGDDLVFTLALDRENNTVTLETEEKTHEFMVKEEDGILRVYRKITHVRPKETDKKQIIYSEDYVPQFAERLMVPVNVEMEAIKILKEARNRGLTVGKNPVGFAVAAIYMVCEKNKIPVNLSILNNDVGYLTIRKKYAELKEGLKDFI